jgi:cytochrome c-type biogenesis protein CcmH
MSVALILIFGGFTATALVFIVWPLSRAGTTPGRLVLAGAAAAFVIGIAGGTYVLVGHPELAVRSLQGSTDTDLNGLISKLAWRVRQSPGDARAWSLLGRGYLTLNDPGDAAAAFKHAAVVAPPQARQALLSAYGESLTTAYGTVTPEAEAAFHAALAGNPSDIASRFYLGQAYAERHDTAHALQMWESLLADAPPNAPWREMLLDRIAMLKGASQGPPNITAMVQGLADRLKTYPEDPVGWRRLVKAYVVLRDLDKARAALADARKALSGDRAQLAALEAEARNLGLQK